jgi:hypothetical protein
MKLSLPLYFIILLVVSACHSPRTVARRQKADIRVCGDTSVNTPHLTWTPATDLPSSVAMNLPASFMLFVVSKVEAETFFKTVKHGDSLIAHVPLPAGCPAFRITSSGTLSEALAEKYPDLVSVKGIAPGSDLRMDWDGKTFSGQVLTNSATYFIEPRNSGDKTWYLIYNKQSAAGRKAPFEQQMQRIQSESPAER